MQWRVEETTPYVHSRRYVAVVVRITPRIGTFHILALPTRSPADRSPADRTEPELRPIDESWGQVPFPFSDPLLHIFEFIFEFDNQAHFKFRNKEVSQRYTSHLSKLAKQYRSGYQMTFESMSRWA